MSRYNVSRYGYDYSLTPARPTGLRGALANITIFATVMAVSAIGGVAVTLELFSSSAPPGVATHAAATVSSATQAAAQPANQRVMQVFALLTTLKMPSTTPTRAPATASTTSSADNHAAPPAAVAAAPAVTPTPAPPVAVQVPQPQPAPVADSDLTFAKGYVQRQAIAHGAPVRHGKVIIEAKAQLGRAAVKPKPKTYARNTNTQDDQRRTANAQPQPGAFGMFQRFDRPDQFDFNHHQALAFGEQRTNRRNNDAPRPASPSYGNSPNGMFGGLF